MARQFDDIQELGVESPQADPIAMSSSEGENLYAEARKSKHRRSSGMQAMFVMAVALVFVYIFALIEPQSIINTIMNKSASGYTLSYFVLDISNNINGLMAVFTGGDTGGVSSSVAMIRYIIIAMAGAGLALCGAVYQGAFRNALVTPSTLGVMSGASIGMTLYVVLFLAAGGSTTELVTTSVNAATTSSNNDVFGQIMSSYGLAIMSFAGCLLVAGIVLLTMRFIRSDMNGIAMIIVGQVLGGVVEAVVASIRYYYVTVEPDGNVADLLTNLQVASFFRIYGIPDLFMIGIPLAATFFVVIAFAPKMQLLAFDEAEIRTMGVDSKRMRIIMVVLCTLLTAIIISFCGRIGYVGFLVPHLARRIVGPDFRILLPASALLGALFVVAAYALLMLFLGPDFQTLVGIFLSIGGAFVFLATVLRGGAARGGFR